jgi:phenylacetate-CoA ligase
MIADHQNRTLHRLRENTYAESAFYRRHHSGLQGAPLANLPPVTKADLMANYDDAVTVAGIHLVDLEQHLRQLVHTQGDPGLPWRGRWWTAATAGTTGRPGIFLWDRAEWASVLASYARAMDWAGVPAGLLHPRRMAVVSSRQPTHQSAVVGASVHSPLVPTLRLDAADPFEDVVEALNRFLPHVLVGYPSALRPLAAAQLGGRLRIAPRAVLSASEVLVPEAAGAMTEAWGRPPFDTYAATETAGIASTCAAGNRHVYEDLVIAEAVDDSYTPVAPGTPGARLLVTVLFARTLPLIRYELSDKVGIDGRGCPCGRSFALFTGVEGRAEDVLQLPGRTGTVAVHPNLFHDVLEMVPGTGWQVIQEPGRLLVLISGVPDAYSLGLTRNQLEAALSGAGVQDTAVHVQTVSALPRTALGKAPLVRALRSGGQ